jgi:hypothetical protein
MVNNVVLLFTLNESKKDVRMYQELDKACTAHIMWLESKLEQK